MMVVVEYCRCSLSVKYQREPVADSIWLPRIGLYLPYDQLAKISLLVGPSLSKNQCRPGHRRFPLSGVAYHIGPRFTIPQQFLQT
jgi:hypothetical protein